jgi:RNA-directed DNA polymerase
MEKAKPFSISKRAVWEAYTHVKANQGAAGVDGHAIAEVERALPNNLYKLWNRLSSGSYFPPPVRRVEIPKGDGRTRPLGMPTVADRIAQTVVKRDLEPEVEQVVHPDSSGDRPGQSALEAVGQARERCWRYDWGLDLDIQGFFDHSDHELLMRAVKKHTDSPWVLLSVERWLKAPVQRPDGTLVARQQGTPQGGVASPLLANLFLHDTVDVWMQRHHPDIPFERYADDAVCHCRSEDQAQPLRQELEQRFAECRLELPPQKTQIVYCKGDDRRGTDPHQRFDCLGSTFRPRRSKNRWGKSFVNFSPAASAEATRDFRRELRRWHLHTRSAKSLEDLSRMFKPVLRGWVNSYSRFDKSALDPTFQHVDRLLVRWALRTYKRLRGHQRRAAQWLRRIARRQPELFAHWRLWQAAGGR